VSGSSLLLNKEIYQPWEQSTFLGLVGTWVAVVVAVIAVIGVVTPILVYRASRTERHKVIAAIEDDNYDYIGRGVWFGPRNSAFQALERSETRSRGYFQGRRLYLESRQIVNPRIEDLLDNSECAYQGL